VIGYGTNETTGGVGANYRGIGGNVSYRQDMILMALRACGPVAHNLCSLRDALERHGATACGSRHS
jgi:hypothetical protein